MSTQRVGGLRLSPLFVGVQLLLVMLAVSRYDASSYVFRGTTAIDFYNWFWRHRLLGFISFFDLLMSGLVGLAAAGILVSRRWWPRCFDALVYGLVLAVVMSTLMYLVHRDLGDTSRGFLYQLRNYAYFAAAYVVASRVRWSERRRRSFAALAAGLAILTMALSWWELRRTPAELLLWKYGHAVTVRDLSDYLFIYFLQFWVVALLLERLPRRWWQRAIVAAGLLYSLYGVFTGVGRGVLLVYPVVLAYIAWHQRLFHRRLFVVGMASTLVLVTIGAAYVFFDAGRIGMGSPLYIYTTFRSGEPAVATRGRELANFAANLYQRKALLLGIGLGSKWYEFEEQPKEDLGAFPKDEWGSGWHLGVHVPFLRMALDFGILGTALLLALFAGCFRSTMRALRLRSLDGVTRAFILSSWAVIGYQLSVNNLTGPKTNLIAGILLGAIAGILREPTTAKRN